MRIFTYVITEDGAGRSVGWFLKKRMLLSGSLFRSLKWNKGAIEVNGEAVYVSYLLHDGDRLSVTVAERHPTSEKIFPCSIPLDILYEDTDLLVVNKPASLPVYSASIPNLIGALLSRNEAEGMPHIVNRLDKDTSGLCIVAQNGYVHDRFRCLLHTRELYREYRAIVCGCPEPPSGTISLALGPQEGKFWQRCVRSDGQQAISDYQLLQKYSDYSLLRLVPHTGRTHQLRVHLSAIGHPLMGDTLYGAPQDAPISRPALHSARLRFTHPVTGQALRFSAPLPEDMDSLL